MIRIAITGIESTGKTTLAAALSVAIGAEVAAEAARNDTRVRAGTTGVADLERLALNNWRLVMEPNAGQSKVDQKQSYPILILRLFAGGVAGYSMRKYPV